MATVSNLDFSVAGDKRRTTGTVTFSSSYTTGGESVTPSQVGLGTILRFDVDFASSSTPAIRAGNYDVTNSKLLAFTTSDGLQVANGTNLSTFSAKFEAVGW